MVLLFWTALFSVRVTSVFNLHCSLKFVSFIVFGQLTEPCCLILFTFMRPKYVFVNELCVGQ